jgi:DNA invertase Pin-like site-specific DNA recombinase
MGQKRHRSEQIIRQLRQAEVELAKGQSAAEVARKLGVTEQTHYLAAQETGSRQCPIGVEVSALLGILIPSPPFSPGR